MLTYEIFSTCYHPLTSDCDLDETARGARSLDERKDGDNNRFWFLSSHLQAICFCLQSVSTRIRLAASHSRSDNHLKALPKLNRGACQRKKGQAKTFAFYSRRLHETLDFSKLNETKYQLLLFVFCRPFYALTGNALNQHFEVIWPILASRLKP